MCPSRIVPQPALHEGYVGLDHVPDDADAFDVLLYEHAYKERTCSRSAEISSPSAPVRMTFMRSSRSDKPSGTRFPVLRLALNRVWKKDTPSILDMKASETMTVLLPALEPLERGDAVRLVHDDAPIAEHPGAC